jgi:5-methylcytosine-specific restriction protein A
LPYQQTQDSSGRKWDLEHIIALCNGGKHEETNMAPALVDPHKVKTKQDRAIKKRNDKIRKRHIGVKKNRTIRQWRKFDGTPVYAAKER